jgi:hypothetical protein
MADSGRSAAERLGAIGLVEALPRARTRKGDVAPELRKELERSARRVCGPP